MGFFEDLIASLQGFVQNEPAPDWKRRDRGIIEGVADDAIASFPEDLILGGERKLTGYPSSKSDAGPSSMYEGVDPSAVRGLAQAKIRSREASEQEQIAREAANAADLQKLIEAGKSASAQRDFMRGTTPLIEDYDKGIAIGGDPRRGSAEDIMFRIRAEAKAKGRNGSLKGGTPTREDYYNSVTPKGGGFTTTEMTPELEKRQAERDAWAAEQPMRDMVFALSREQQQMRPRQAATAAELLPQMQQQSVLRKKQALQEKLVDRLADGSGKIPFEQAMQLEAANVPIPVGARGIAPEQFDAMISNIISGSTRDLQTAIEAQNNGAPQETINMIVGFSSSVRDKAMRIKELVDSGQMKRDEAAKILQEIIEKEERATNAVAEFQLINPQSMVPVAQAGE